MSIGIISDTDLVARMSPETHPGILEQLVSKLPLGHRSAEARSHLQKARGKTAADLMTEPVITLRADESIGTALAMSAEKHIKRFPVVDADGKTGRNRWAGRIAQRTDERSSRGKQTDGRGNA